MEYTLHVQLSNAEGAVIRALGLVERRGFTIKRCTVGEPDNAGRELNLTVTSERSGDLLKRQLERLHDVFFVELVPVKPAMQNKRGIRPVTRRV